MNRGPSLSLELSWGIESSSTFMSNGPSDGALGIDSSSAMSQEGLLSSLDGGGGRGVLVSGLGMICFTLGASMYEADQKDNGESLGIKCGFDS